MKSFIVLLVLACFNLHAKDLSSQYHSLYDAAGPVLTPDEIGTLASNELVLINGIGSEFFLKDFIIDVSWATTEYFGVQKAYFEKMGMKVSRLAPSSFGIQKARAEVKETFDDLRARKVKATFITHSLGGLLVLEHLVKYPADQDLMGGVVFLQSPFHGSPVASILRKAPLDTVEYLKVKNREAFLNANAEAIASFLAKVPVVLMAGVANQSNTVFTSTANFIRKGCLVVVRGRCTSIRRFKGPYDFSDGMVPLSSSHLNDADHVTIPTVDHGETVMNLPFQSVLKTRMSEVLLKLLLEKSKI